MLHHPEIEKKKSLVGNPLELDGNTLGKTKVQKLSPLPQRCIWMSNLLMHVLLAE
jgi:hypothetical protein